MMKRGFFILCALLAATTTWGSESQTVKVGVNIGLSSIGATANTNELQQAIELAQKQLNERENAPYRYELLFEDNKGTPAGAAHATQKLINIDKVDTIITIYDFAVAATLPIIESHKIPSIGFGWGVEYAKPPYSILFGYSEIASANTLYDGLKNKDIPTTIIAINQASLPRFVKQMQLRAKEDGLSEFEAVYISPTENDFRSTLLKIKASGCQRLVLIAWGNPLNKLLYQMRQMPDFTPEIWGMGAALSTAQDKEMVNGAIVFAPATPNDKFINTYKDFSGHAPLANDPYGYDSLMLLAESLENSNSSDLPMREKIAQALHDQTTFEGITGTYTQQDGIFDTSPQLYRLTEDGDEVPFLP